MIDVAVCIATCERPEGLRRLLASMRREFANQRIVAVIVDNSLDGRELGCAAELSRLLGAPAEVHHQPVPGIPMARNLSVERALRHEPSHLVFVDDDERVMPGWLDALSATMRDCEADVVSGPVLPELPPDAPSWLSTCGAFERRRLASGTVMNTTATNNTLAKADWFRAGGRFDERLQFVGGSDTELFARMASEGFRIVWSDEAVVVETVPPERANLRWLIQRRQRIGQNLVHRRRTGMAGTVAPVRLWRLAARVPATLVLAPVALLTGGRAGAARRIAWGAVGWGVLTAWLGRQHEEYRTAARSTP